MHLDSSLRLSPPSSSILLLRFSPFAFVPGLDFSASLLGLRLHPQLAPHPQLYSVYRFLSFATCSEKESKWNLRIISCSRSLQSVRIAAEISKCLDDNSVSLSQSHILNEQAQSQCALTYWPRSCFLPSILFALALFPNCICFLVYLLSGPRAGGGLTNSAGYRSSTAVAGCQESESEEGEVQHAMGSSCCLHAGI